MIKFNVDKRYKMKTLPSEISIGEAIKLASLSTLSEDEYVKLIEFDSFNGSLSGDQRNYIINILVTLTNAKYGILSKTSDKDLMSIFDYAKPIINIIFFQDFNNYTPYGVDEINFKGVKYSLPESLIINDDNIQAFKEPSKCVTEAGNLISTISNLKAQGIKYLPILCAIYLQPINSVRSYDEKGIAERSKLFKDLPLSIALDIFFFIYLYSINFVMLSRLSLIPKKVILINKIKNKLTSMFGFMRLRKQVY